MPGDPSGARGPRLRAPWTRSDWTRLADLLLASARRFASPGHARITLPGPEGGYGGAVDGLEGFARTFLVVHDPIGVLVEWPDGRSTITHDPGPLRALVSKESG